MEFSMAIPRTRGFLYERARVSSLADYTDAVPSKTPALFLRSFRIFFPIPGDSIQEIAVDVTRCYGALVRRFIIHVGLLVRRTTGQRSVPTFSRAKTMPARSARSIFHLRNDRWILSISRPAYGRARSAHSIIFDDITRSVNSPLFLRFSRIVFPRRVDPIPLFVIRIYYVKLITPYATNI